MEEGQEARTNHLHLPWFTLLGHERTLLGQEVGTGDLSRGRKGDGGAGGPLGGVGFVVTPSHPALHLTVGGGGI